MSEVPTLDEVFPFEYIGGGYFRRKGVPRGVSADILHGMQAVEFVREAIAEELGEEPAPHSALCRNCFRRILSDDGEDDGDWVHEDGLATCSLDGDKAGAAEPFGKVLVVWDERSDRERGEDLPALPEADMDGAGTPRPSLET